MDPDGSPNAPPPGALDGSGDPSPPAALDRALDLVRFLRANCSWDAEQTARSLVPHLLEEANEVVDAIHADDAGALRDELGDLLLNVAFQVVVAEEAGHFDADAVADALEHKMKRRHPHLYGLGERTDWERIKAQERAEQAEEETSRLDGIPRGLAPLYKAHRLQERAAAVGFDWPDAQGAVKKMNEEVAEVLAASTPSDLEEELGDLLFAVGNVARLSGAHAADCLVRANQKFERRFRAIERAAEGLGGLEALSLEEMDALWERVKREEPAPS